MAGTSPVTVCGVDKGIRGAMVCLRHERAGEVPTIIRSSPYCWRYRSIAKLEKDIATLRCQFGIEVAAYQPALIGWESAFSRRGRYGVGLAQAAMGGRLKEWAEFLRVPWVEVNPQGPKRVEAARGLYRSQVRLILENPPPDFWDALAVADATLAEALARRKGGTPV